MDSQGFWPRNGQPIPNQRNSQMARSTGELHDTFEELTRRDVAARPMTPEVAPNDFLPGLPTRRWAQEPSQPSSPESPGSHSKTTSRPLIFRSISGEDDDVFGKSKESIPVRPRRRTVDEGTPATQSSTRKLQKRLRGTSMQEGRPTIPPRRGSGKRFSQAQLQADLGRDVLAWPSPSDARRTLHLMSATRGRMQGALYFREGSSGTWYVAHCFIDHEESSLLCETSYGRIAGAVLVPDLRGAEVLVSTDPGQQGKLIQVHTPDLPVPIQLRPLDTSCFDRWLAALLCWTAVSPNGKLKNGFRQSIPAPLLEPSGNNRRSVDGSRSSKDGAVVKIGKLGFLDTGESDANWQPFQFRPTAGTWVEVSCILYQNGTLRILTESHDTSIARLRLSKMPRSTVQRLDPSVLGTDYCIAIYPQYAVSSGASSRLRPIYLSVDSRVTFESWFVLLRAFAIPEIYGHQQGNNASSLQSNVILPGLYADSNPSLFRLERSLRIRVCEARLHEHTPPPEAGHEGRKGEKRHAQRTPDGSEYYVQVLLDGQIRAKTAPKPSTGHLYWFEYFDIQDLGAIMPCVTVQVLKRDGRPGSKEAADGNIILSPQTQKTLSSQNSDIDDEPGHLVGEATFEVRSRERISAEEQRYALFDAAGEQVGNILLRFKADLELMLMDAEYQQLSELLHNMSNGLTISIAERLPSENAEVFTRYCETLLNIFQASGRATDWLMSLAEEEVDGVRKEAPASHMRYTQRIEPNDADSIFSYGLPADREGFVRGMGKHATAEANLLFRGNTLLSKSLDAHMRRVGKEYLEETIGPEMRAIAELDPDCEVDPNKLPPSASHDRNWRRLITLTQKVWASIASSPLRCPDELRAVFRHIRACAEDRYGDFLRTVTYSSVSGFLFLRFFCPAVLNPKLFSLIKFNPRPRAARTFLLIAKSLQNLANLTTSGSKEPFMERMNEFLTSQRQPFKDFIDEICAVPAGQPSTDPALQYSTPLAIFSRLPAAHKEGFPALPYLIDHARDFAALVKLWLDNISDDSSSISHSTTTSKFAATSGILEGDILRFHGLCLHLRQRARASFDRAERTERRSTALVQKWVTIAERMESNPSSFWVPQFRQLSQQAQAQQRQMRLSQDAIAEDEGPSQPQLPAWADLTPSVSASGTGTPLPVNAPYGHYASYDVYDDLSAGVYSSLGAGEAGQSVDAFPVTEPSDVEQPAPASASASASVSAYAPASTTASATEQRPRSRPVKDKPREKEKSKFGLFGRKKR